MQLLRQADLLLHTIFQWVTLRVQRILAPLMGPLTSSPGPFGIEALGWKWSGITTKPKLITNAQVTSENGGQLSHKVKYSGRWLLKIMFSAGHKVSSPIKLLSKTIMETLALTHRELDCIKSLKNIYIFLLENSKMKIWFRKFTST